MHTYLSASRHILIFLALLLAVIVSLPVSTSAQGNSDNAKLCHKGGWQTLARTESPTVSFSSEGECVSYGAHGGMTVAVEADDDGDGVGNVGGGGNPVDNCPFIPNPDQADADGDGIGNVCEQASLTWAFTPGGDGTHCTATAIVRDLFPMDREYLIVVSVNSLFLAADTFTPSSDGSFSYEVPHLVQRPVEPGARVGADIETSPERARIITVFATASC